MRPSWKRGPVGRWWWFNTSVWESMEPLHTALTFSTTFSSHKIQESFWDISQKMLISDSKMIKNEALLIAFCPSIPLLCLLSISYSYVHIFPAVSRISSLQGRSKALSTCLPHLVVVILFLSTDAMVFLKPASESKWIVLLVLSVFYTVVPVSVNPIIYSLRNKDIKVAVRKFLAVAVN